MNYEAIMKKENVKNLAREIKLAVSEKFEASIAANRKRRQEAQAAFDRILDAPQSGIPFEEAAGIVGLNPSDLRSLILSESIPYVDRQGNMRVSCGLFPDGAPDFPGKEPAFLRMHTLMILTGTLQTPECQEIMEIVLEAQKILNKRMASDY